MKQIIIEFFVHLFTLFFFIFSCIFYNFSIGKSQKKRNGQTGDVNCKVETNFIDYMKLLLFNIQFHESLHERVKLANATLGPIIDVIKKDFKRSPGDEDNKVIQSCCEYDESKLTYSTLFQTEVGENLVFELFLAIVLQAKYFFLKSCAYLDQSSLDLHFSNVQCHFTYPNIV